jgi:hypothetical protein
VKIRTGFPFRLYDRRQQRTHWHCAPAQSEKTTFAAIIPVTDIDHALRFYDDVLGLDVAAMFLGF